MPLFARRPSLPADVRDALDAQLRDRGLRTPARVLAWTKTLDGVLVGLPELFAVLEAGGRWTLQPWHEVLHVTWAQDGTQLTWTTLDGPTTRRSVGLVDPGRMPELMRERVEQTMVVQRRLELAPGRGVTVSGRRPAEGGDIRWLVTPSPGVDLTDPRLAAAAQELLDRIRRDWA